MMDFSAMSAGGYALFAIAVTVALVWIVLSLLGRRR
jgi:hypothetical protein